MTRLRIIPALLLLAVLAACGPETKQQTVVRPSAAAQAPAAAPEPQASPPTAQQPEAPPAPAPGATDVLLKQVDGLYQAGMSDYSAGNLEGARQKLDQALSTLLESSLDVGSDDRLSAEFEKVVEDTYSAEVAVIERGDTMGEHRYEPAPIESFAGLTFPVDPKVKEQVQEEIKSVQSDLPLVSNDYVDGVIGYLQHHARGYMQTILEREGRYQPLISKVLREEGLPQDLIFLAAAESAFNPFAVSSQKCVGIWQFGRSTAENYGLQMNRWVDEREDPAKSTHAAARHLKELYQQFGDWFLVMAAYDAGPVTVQKAIEKTGYADYWELRRLNALPKETQDYVPIFLATALVAKNAKAYGFDVPADSPLEDDQVTVSVPTDLRLVAQLIDHPPEDLVRLNPSLQRWATPGNDPTYVLNLPPGTKQAYEERIEAVPPDKRIWWRAHKVEPGETLPDIARKFKLTSAALASANGMDRGASVAEGAHLLLPVAPGAEWSLDRVHPRAPRKVRFYKVRPGDTVDLIADRFDASAYEIRRWNNLRNSRLTPGATLKVYVPASTSSGHHTAVHRKKPAAKPAGKKQKST
ncbi:MAG: transglycosylase SLT domain-containing protein [Terriglobia bacterium]